MLSFLIIEDNPLFSLAVSELLKDYGTVTQVNNRQEALQNLQTKSFDIAFIDLWLGEQLEGIQLVDMANQQKIYSVVVSSSEKRNEIIEAYQAGCKDFLSKENFRRSLPGIIAKYQSIQNNDLLFKFLRDEFITQDQDFIQDLKFLQKMNTFKKALLITGSTGSGKSLVAKLLHRMSGGNDKNFININCSEFSENLLESELFGHMKGSFTGAIKDKKGKLQLADGGTLFLDEISTMPLSLQTKLLKVLEEKSFYPVGAEKEISSDFRVISATCDDLFTLIKKGDFREDLFFRLNGMQLHLKSLKERATDIPHLVKHFIKKEGRQIIITDEAMTLLKRYSWPGNVRELKHIIEYLAYKENGLVQPVDLPSYITLNSSPFNPDQKDDSLLTSKQRHYIRTYGLKGFMEGVEKEIVNEVLRENDYKVRPTIKQLKITSSVFYRIYEKLGHAQHA